MNYKKEIFKEDGHSLISVILISLLITTVILSLITYILFSNIITSKAVNKKKLDLLCKTAVELEKINPLPDSSITYIVKIDSSEITINKRLKGIFLEITAQAKNALTLSEHNSQLTVTGTTSITGNILFTGKEITKGRILGLQTPDKNFHKGMLLKSEESNLEVFKDSVFTNIFSFQKNNFDITFDSEFILDQSTYQLLKNKNVYLSSDLTIRDSLFLESAGAAIKFAVGGKVKIKEGTKTNINLEIYCDSSVVIEKNSVSKNLVIVSKSGITIEKNSVFTNTQLISGSGILINGSQFNYPTNIALYVDVSQEKMLDASIEIESSFINGSVLLCCSTTGIQSNKSKILINNSTVKGIVYSENYSEITGSIVGSLFTYRLKYYKKPTEYINWMVNLNINRNDLDNSFLCPIGFKNTSPTVIGEASPNSSGSENNFETLKETWIY